MKTKEGYLYIISNSVFPGYFKVGVTQDINKRLKVYQTGDPNRSYKVEFYIFHPDCYAAEKRIKESMRHFSTDIIQNGEWFKISKHMAISRLEEQVEDLEIIK